MRSGRARSRLCRSRSTRTRKRRHGGSRRRSRRHAKPACGGARTLGAGRAALISVSIVMFHTSFTILWVGRTRQLNEHASPTCSPECGSSSSQERRSIDTWGRPARDTGQAAQPGRRTTEAYGRGLRCPFQSTSLTIVDVDPVHLQCSPSARRTGRRAHVSRRVHRRAGDGPAAHEARAAAGRARPDAVRATDARLGPSPSLWAWRRGHARYDGHRKRIRCLSGDQR